MPAGRAELWAAHTAPSRRCVVFGVTYRLRGPPSTASLPKWPAVAEGAAGLEGGQRLGWRHDGWYQPQPGHFPVGGGRGTPAQGPDWRMSLHTLTPVPLRYGMYLNRLPPV